MAKCRICYRNASNEFCGYHEQAYNELKKHYEVWCSAYGKITWKKYLERLLELKETGSWVREVIILKLKEKRV